MTPSVVAGRSTISVVVRNDGNVRLKPTGDFVLWDSTGTQVTSFPITMDTFYAHTDTTVEVPFSQLLNPGTYTATLDLHDATGATATSGKLPLVVAVAAAPVAPPSAAAPSLAQANQAPAASGAPAPVAETPAAAAASPSPLMLVLIAFGAGLALMLAAGGVGYAVYRRRKV